MVGERSGFGNLFKPPFSLTVLMVDYPSDLTKNEFTVAEHVEIVKKIGKGSELNCPSESIPRVVGHMDGGAKDRMETILKMTLNPKGWILCKKIERRRVFCKITEGRRVFYNGTEGSRVFCRSTEGSRVF